MDERPESQAATSVPQYPCGICGRTFYPEVLARHQGICQKSAAKKRKVFDSRKARIQGTDMEKAMVEAQFRKKTTVEEPSAKGGKSRRPGGGHEDRAIEGKKNNWRTQHENFIAAIRGAREVTKAMKTGAPLPPPPPPAENPDYVKCDFCTRRFKPEAAERHIPFCRDKASRLNKSGKTVPAAAKEKLDKRNTYRVPLPGAKKRTSMDGPGQQAGPGSHRAPSQTDIASQRQQQQQQRDAERRAAGGMTRQRPPAGPPGARAVAAARTNGATAPPAGGRPPTTGTYGHGEQEQPGRRQPAAGQRRVGVPGTRQASLPGQRQTNRDQEQWAPDDTPPPPKGPAPQHRRQVPGSVARNGSRNGMNSTYTLRQNGSGAPTPALDLSPADQYEQSPGGGGNGLMHSGRGSARRKLQEAAEFNQHQQQHYTSELYIDATEQAPLGRSSSASTSGVSDMSDVSLPPIGTGRKLSHGSHAQMQQGPGTMSRFCYDCGTRFPVPNAKFCCECGKKRLPMPST
ncbi:zinc finger C2HC domain-containing protein 1A-like isoform X1 [Sycon ciliatum]|uniref:zinc finger C2HC domain-containing protein 1A-like isoform X1 n=1 Tax=Sycon ciliatum TaxID=27933 RepID=UPI0031F6C4CA